METFYDVPVWLARQNHVSFTLPAETGESNIARAGHLKLEATRFSVDYQTEKVAARLFGQSGSYEQPHAGPVRGTISYDAYYMFTGDNEAPEEYKKRKVDELFTGDEAAIIKVGDAVFRECYLTNFRVSADPSQGVVTYQATWDFYSGATGTIGSNSYANYHQTTVEGYDYSQIMLRTPWIAAAHTLSVDGNELGQTTAIEYTVSCPRRPVYRLGDTTPSTVKLVSLEKAASVRGSLTNFINYTGRSAYLNVSGRPLAQQSGTYADQPIFFITGDIISQNMTMAENDVVQGNFTIREVVI